MPSLTYMFCRNLAGNRFSKAGSSAYLHIRSSPHGRGAVEPRARGDDNQGEKNDFLRFQEQLLRRKKQKLFLGVSVGNGVRWGITLHKTGGASAIKVNFIALTLHYLCKRNQQNILCPQVILLPRNYFYAHELHEWTRISFNG